MRVNHRCPHILVAQQLLHSSNIVSLFQQVGRKAVAQGMTTSVLRNLRLSQGLFHGRLHSAVGDVVPALLSTARVVRTNAGWKDILPTPLGVVRSDTSGRAHKAERPRHNPPRDPPHAAALPFANDA